MIKNGVLTIDTAEVFEPLLKPARYKGAHGGRGSGKSHFFAELMVDDSLRIPGLRSVCIREVQRTLKESAKRLIEDKIISLNVGDRFRVLDDRIETPGNGVIAFQGMQDHNAETIKSLEGFSRAWVEEAQTLSERSLTLLRPTIRTENSELWFSWNPRRKIDAVDHFLRNDPPKSALVVQANWRDNPWFPDVLRAERDEDLRKRPDQCEHIWEGAYVKVFQGAYFAQQIMDARKEGRITRVSTDPLLRKRAVWDIGGSGRDADANAIWIVQSSNREILVLDYIEGQGQTLGYYVNELRERGHSNALCVLPHDGVNSNTVTGKRFEEHLNDAGFETKVVTNQGKGAAMMRIEAVRRLFPRIWFNEATTEPGLDALGSYHAKIDPVRQNDLGPEHDWSSHGADAFGLMCVEYEQPRVQRSEDRYSRRTPSRSVWV
jgi:phage terminase large subunit